MVLVFNFEYVSKNALLENFLVNELKDLKYSFQKDGVILKMFVEGEQDELALFATQLSSALPVSIYFKALSVELCEELPPQTYKPKEFQKVLTFTPKMIQDHNFNPFVTPDVGLKPTCKEELVYDGLSDFEEIFTKCAQDLIEKRSVSVKTFSGIYKLQAIKDEKIELGGEDFILATDLSVVEKMVIVQENEIKALASLEKPRLYLPLNQIFASKELLDKPFVKIGLANDMISYLLSLKLFESGINFVVCSKSNEAQLSFEGEMPLQSIEVSVLENGEIIPTKGEYFADDSLKGRVFESLKHKHFINCMVENSLLNEKVLGFYLSKTSADAIMVYSDELVDLAGIEFLLTGEAIFEEISKFAGGDRLLENYKNAFSEDFEKASKLDLGECPKNIASVMGFAGVVLGYASTIEEGLEAILNNATLFSGLKGPRIDFLFLGEKATSGIDPYRIIRSGMSFRLAGVDPLTLSFGYVDSLAYFVSDTTDRLKDEFGVTHVALSGGMFGHKKLSSLASSRILSGFKVAFNKELPIEG